MEAMSKMDSSMYDEFSSRESQESASTLTEENQPSGFPSSNDEPVKSKSGSIMREVDELNEEQIMAKIQEFCNTQPLKSIYSIEV